MHASLTFAAASAAPQTFDFKDPKGVNHAKFTLDAPLETISGVANGVSGTLTVDTDKPEATSGTITVETKSLHVENPLMKEHMLGADWLDAEKNFTKPAELRATFDALLASPMGHMDAREMIDRMIAIVPADTGKVRNVSPKAVEDMLKEAQAAAWNAEI